MAPYGLTTYINLTGQWDELQIERHEQRFFPYGTIAITEHLKGLRIAKMKIYIFFCPLKEIDCNQS